MTSPTNLQRAVWAEAAINVFREQTGCDHEESLGDLLCDLRHWAGFVGLDFEIALERAQIHFELEVQQ